MIDPKLLRIIGITIRDQRKRFISQNRVMPKSKKTGGTTLIESRRLVNSINYQIGEDKVFVGPGNLVYGKIHHEGGVITPKKAKFLAIPLTKMAKVNQPRNFQNTFIRNGIIFRKLDDGKIEALYVLKKKVVIPERKYMELTSEDQNILYNRIQSWWKSR